MNFGQIIVSLRPGDSKSMIQKHVQQVIRQGAKAYKNKAQNRLAV